MEIKFDQHFLEDMETIEKEIEISNITKEDIILEIGAGDGRISKEILKTSQNLQFSEGLGIVSKKNSLKIPKKLISIEKDENFREKLQILKQSYPKNFEFIIGDGLEEILKHKFNKLISNIPYSITEPLYKIILEKQIKNVILIHGEKFYKQILSKKSKWHYFVNSFYDVKLIKEVPGNYFEPIAKVKSVLLKLELKTNFSKEEFFFRELFNRQNRNTKNAIIFSLVEIGKTLQTKKVSKGLEIVSQKNFLTKKEANEIILNLNLPKEILNKKFESISNRVFIKIIEKIN